MFRCIVAARTEYISPQSDSTNFRRKGRRGSHLSNTTSSPPVARNLEHQLSPPPRLPINSTMSSLVNNTASGTTTTSAISPGAKSVGNRLTGGSGMSNTGGMHLGPPDQQHSYDPMPNFTSEKMQVRFIVTV